METDRTEMYDLSQELPEKVTELSEMYDEWAATNHVLPWNEILKLRELKKRKVGKKNND